MLSLRLVTGFVGAGAPPSVASLRLFTGFVGAGAPHPAARGPALLHLPLGPFHFPRPLEVQVLFTTEVHPVMPLLAPAVHIIR
jgi:hypothetical protein